MKSQRRQELKVNTLDQALAHLPSRAREYAPTIAMAIGIILVGLLVRYRMSAANDRAVRAADNLAVVQEELTEVKSIASVANDPSQVDELFKDAISRIELILSQSGSSNPKVAAQALVARGDFYWNVAGIVANATQPSTTGQSADELLSGAQQAYQQVVTEYSQQDFSACAARFGLAAIAENRHDWDVARTQYQAVVNDAQAGDLLHEEAADFLQSLDSLQHPPLIGQSPATPPAAIATPAPAGPPVPSSASTAPSSH